jgi:transposase-like protein
MFQKSDDLLLYEIFKGRCPKCRRVAVTIHELAPRSRGAGSMLFTNRTPICAECHDTFHRNGASPSQIEIWHGIIKTYLINIGTSEQYYARAHLE